MKKTDNDTTVGVDDPYRHVDRCDHLTNDGTCRFAIQQADRDPQFARERRAEDFRCPVAGDPDEPGADGPWKWRDCPHFRCRNRDRSCVRCGLVEERMAHEDERPLLEEHHLSYRDDGVGRGPGGGVYDGPAGDADEEQAEHEITVFLCRWCHAKVHKSWARIDDDVSPDPEAIAEREQRRARQHDELDFDSAADRYDSA